MNNLEVLNYGNKLLKNSNISSYKLDSELLLAKVLNFTREKLLINLDKIIDKKSFKAYKNLIARRKKKNLLHIFLKIKNFGNIIF